MNQGVKWITSKKNGNIKPSPQLTCKKHSDAKLVGKYILYLYLLGKLLER